MNCRTMTPRQRILAAIAHREADRVPVDLGATPSSGISAIAYNKLTSHLQLDVGPAKIYDVVQQLAQVDDAVLDHFAIDVIDLGRTFNTSAGDWKPIQLSDGSTALHPQWFTPRREDDGSYTALHADGTPIAMMPAGGTFFDQTCFPYVDGYPDQFDDLDAAMGKVLWSALVHSPWDHAGEPDFWQTLRSHAIKLRQTSDRAVMIVAGCNLFEWGTFLRRMDNFLMDLAAEPDHVQRLLDALMQRHLAMLEKLCAAVGDVVDIIRFGDDLGMDGGPFMSPDTYRKLFKPRHAQLCAYVHKHSQMHTFLHSCGGIRPLLPDLIEAGFEILNPVQTNCTGMEAAQLKRDFGDAVTFWGGGADTRHVLNRKSPREVADHVKQRLDIFSPGGGYVFNTIHNILPEVPPQNIAAMFEAVANFNAS